MRLQPLQTALLIPTLFLGMAAFPTTADAGAVAILIQPLTEDASKDTKIYDNSPDSNFSSTLDVYGPETGANFSSLIQFDTTRLQGLTGAKILSASLSIYSYSTTPINGTLTVSPILSPWAETAAENTATGFPLATYNAFFGTSPTISLGAVASTQTITSTGYHSLDVLSIVKAWADGTYSNNGFYLKGTAGITPIADTDSPFAGIAPGLSVVVDDTVPPQITTTPAARTLNVGATGKVALPDLRTELVATDNIGLGLISQSPAPGTLLSPGNTTVTLTVRDLANLAVQAGVVVTVTDVTAPTFTQPAPLTLTADPVTGLALVPDVTTNLIAADNVGITTRTQAPAAGTTLPPGDSVIQVTLKDAAQNTTIVSVEVEVDYARPANSAAATLVASTGGPAPSAGTVGGVAAGTTVTAFSTPSISAQRDLVALARLMNGNAASSAIYAVSAAGNPSLLAFPGASSGIAQGVVFKSFSDPVISAGGKVAFPAVVAGPGINLNTDQGVWTDAFGATGLHAVLREGRPVPGLPAGVLLKSAVSISLRDEGLLALITLWPGQGGVNANNDMALILQTDDHTATVVARKGTPLTAGGSPVKSLLALTPTLLSPGQGRSQGEETAVAMVTLQNGASAIVKLKAGVPTPVLATGAPAFVGPYGAVWQTFGIPATDRAGTHLAFRADFRIGQGAVSAANDSTLIYSDDDTNFSLIAREGFSAQGVPGATFKTFFDPVVNSNGDIAFAAFVQGAGVNNTNFLGLWWGQADDYGLLARQGSIAPGIDGQPLSAKWANFTSYALPDGNQSGPIILGKLAGAGVNATNDTGVWAVDSHGNLRLLLRTSDQVNIGTVGTPVVKTVKGIGLLDARAGVYGASRSFNATGSLATQVTFTDNTSTIIRVDIP